MGLFDDIEIEDPKWLEPASRGLAYQTKDLENTLDRFRITRAGRLEMLRYRQRWIEAGDEMFLSAKLHHDAHWAPDPSNTYWEEYDVDFHGRIAFGAIVRDADGHYAGRSYEYEATFTHGQLEGIRRVRAAGDANG